jgi:hypothetical protein
VPFHRLALARARRPLWRIAGGTHATNGGDEHPEQCLGTPTRAWTSNIHQLRQLVQASQRLRATLASKVMVVVAVAALGRTATAGRRVAAAEGRVADMPPAAPARQRAEPRAIHRCTH